MTSTPLLIDGASLSIESLISIRDGEVAISLAPEAKQKMIQSRKAIEDILDSDAVVYGINTGFGAMSRVQVDQGDLAKLQANLIRSHACGVGELMAPEHVLMMMAIRSNSLAVGHSGIRPEIVETIIEMVNERMCPIIPRIGSLGASGDLAPLSHLALGLIGEADFLIESDDAWDVIDAEEAYSRLGRIPITLEAKEGLSLINGTSQMCTYLADSIYALENLVFTADCAVATSVEAIKGSHKAFDSRIHSARPHLGQTISAARISSLLSNSEINASHVDCDRVQDPYSIRCAPQVHGPVIEALQRAREMLEIELNSATDNPLVFVNEDSTHDVISGGNFHGENLGIIADNLAVCAHELGSISERRTNLMMSPQWTGLPAFLAVEEGLESGLMIVQYVSAACLAELHLLANPATTTNVPVSMEKEDHVSMGATACYRLLDCCDLLSRILANELISGLGCLRLLSEAPGEGVGQVMNLVDEFVPPLDSDQSLSEVSDSLAYALQAGLIHDF